MSSKTVTLKLEGTNELAAAIRAASEDVKLAAFDVMQATGLELKGDIENSIRRGPATGKVYRKPGGITHQASAPGEAPMSDEGRLAGSIVYEEIAADTAVEVSSNIAYALALELGTWKMAARPFFRPAIERAQPKFIKRLEIALGRVFK